MNTRESFWDVYCFATNQMRDETAKDNQQTAAAISHDLIRLREFFNFPFLALWKSYFLPQTNTSHLIPSVQKLPNWPKSECKLWMVKFRVTDKGFSATKIYGSKITNHSQLAWPFELHVKQTQRNFACDWLIFSSSQTRCLAVSDRLILSSWFTIAHRFSVKISFISILLKPKSKTKNFSIWKR